MLDVCLLGCGGMMPLPYRYLTSLMLRFNGSSLLIDCGEATQIAMKKKGWSPNPIDAILFTHYHADHISGLPGMLLTLGNAERTDPVLLIGPKGLERVVRSLLVIAPELPFELKIHEIEGNEEDICINGYNIRAFKVNHNVLCYGYTISIKRAGRFNDKKAKELDIPIRMWNRLQKGEECVTEDGRHFTPDMVMGKERRGIKVTYTTDTRPVKSIRDNAAGSDLFICEGMYGEDDKFEKAKENKHMMFSEAARLAKEADVKELWLTHYSPSLMDPRIYMDDIKKIFPAAKCGKDGKTVVLDYEEE
ncbi:MAG: ribonuclease Z [Lachnospiraceae bacterium]|nr:ribonuclease Z [Lachnospiraceae bacterium]